MILLYEQSMTRMPLSFHQSVPHRVHHPPPMMLQRHDFWRSMVSILIRSTFTMLLSSILLILTVSWRDPGKAIGKDMRRVRSKYLFHLAKSDALNNLVHLFKVTIMANNE
ncbi:hypothetical protein PanWU01x14_254610 [Parasponia andersonii]|uniref:Transmembrane protein n=1 Tax=Parasponia andersonii TaxID=3476 RepID=A0A2P5BB95_PARAD|nr:hypothetical protein PanWU01x14_254610 [Parasponia andersonii]